MQDLAQHLLTHLTEEAAEIIQRVQKIERFGLDEIQEGKTQTNRRRLAEEVNQLEAVVGLLRACGILPEHDRADHDAKLANMVCYAQLSVDRGRLDPTVQLKLKGAEERHTRKIDNATLGPLTATNITIFSPLRSGEVHVFIDYLAGTQEQLDEMLIFPAVSGVRADLKFEIPDNTAVILRAAIMQHIGVSAQAGDRKCLRSVRIVTNRVDG